MDKGQNEKAAILLEKIVEEQPENREAKILLASAYMGQAGVDIYKLHDTFKDVLFNQPLSERFWGKSAGADPLNDPSSASFDEKMTVSELGPDGQPLPIIQMINTADRILIKSKKAIEFLSRFPDVPKEKWPLLDSGLQLLDGAGDERDLCLYRVFFRVIYLKAYFSHEFLRDPDMPRKKWLCSIDLGNLRESVDWILKHLTAASEDFQRAFPKRAATLNSIQAMSHAIRDELTQLEQSKDGTNSGLIVIQNGFRSSLRCGK
jgi:hypothetical protein